MPREWVSDDAKKLVRHLYNRTQESGYDDSLGVQQNDIQKSLGWDETRYKQAVRESRDLGLTQRTPASGNDFATIRLTFDGRRAVLHQFERRPTTRITESDVSQVVSTTETSQATSLTDLQMSGHRLLAEVIENTPPAEGPRISQFFWLCYDLLDAWNNIINNAPNDMINRALSASCLRGDALDLAAHVRSELHQLYNTTSGYDDSDWSPQTRELFAYEVRLIFNEVARLLQSGQAW